MSKCLYCYQELEEGQKDFHPACAKKFFGKAEAPVLPYSRDNINDLARALLTPYQLLPRWVLMAGC